MSSTRGSEGRNDAGGRRRWVPVRVMLPLDTFVFDKERQMPRLKNRDWLDRVLGALREARADGVSVDVWWGMFAIDGMRYDFSPVVELAELCLKHRMHLTCIMSFHVCGNSVGDTVHVPMPSFVVDAVKELGKGSGFYCADCHGNEATDAFSPAADELPLTVGDEPVPTTLLALYTTFMELFAFSLREEKHMFGPDGVVDEIAIGMGPCGELRYPSYDETLGWKWPEVGRLMCFDPHMRELAAQRGVVVPDVAAAAVPALSSDDKDAEVPLAPLFSNKDLFDSAETQQFLKFYDDILAEHADRMLQAAQVRAFRKEHKVRLSVKFSGIHWMHKLPTRPAEVCAGYWEYDKLLQVVAKNGAGATFTCYDMDTDVLADERPSALSDPDALVSEFAEAARRAEVAFLAAENSLESWDAVHFDKMRQNIVDNGATSFTFLRVTPSTYPYRTGLSRRAQCFAVTGIASVIWTVFSVLAANISSESNSITNLVVVVLQTLVLTFVTVLIYMRRVKDTLNVNFMQFISGLRRIE